VRVECAGEGGERYQGLLDDLHDSVDLLHSDNRKVLEIGAIGLPLWDAPCYDHGLSKQFRRV
jgi:hypothetical protein